VTGTDPKFRILRTVAAIGFSAVAVSTFAVSAQANLVFNGGFETNNSNGLGGQIGFNGVTVAGWSTTGFNFLFAPGTADTTGAFGADGQLYLWGPNNGSFNGLPTTSPDGGYFVAADGNYGSGPNAGINGRMTAPITQTINLLIPGDVYTVSFYWAASQQYGFSGATDQHFTVGFGSSSQDTPTFNLPSHGFSGWMLQTFNFTADSTSDVLSFLAVSSVPLPPFLLLDGVSVDGMSTPEPGSVFLMLSGLAVMGGMIARRAKSR